MGNLPVIVTEEENTWHIDKGEITNIFKCNHEEADTRVILHASLSSDNIIVVASDTDVLVLMINAFAKLQPTKDWQMLYESSSYTSIRHIQNKLGMTICTLLPQLHGLTGCDATSFFFKVGKVSPFNKVLKNIENFQLISALGVNTIYVEDCKRFIQIVMYAGDNKETYVDTHIQLFKQQRTKATMRIPPDADSAKQAIHRVHHQVHGHVVPKYGLNQFHMKKMGGSMMWKKPVWFTGPQFPPVTKRTKTCLVYRTAIPTCN